MAVKIEKTENGSVIIGNAEYPSGNYKLTYGEDSVEITPLFPNLDFETIKLKINNILDDSNVPLADMTALKAYLSGVFFGTDDGAGQ